MDAVAGSDQRADVIFAEHRDRLFGTYCAKSAGEENIVIGLPIFRGMAERSILRLLTQPLRNGGNPQR